MNHTNHRANTGSFRRGQDRRRNTSGQQSKDAVALGALLKKYLIEEASKPPKWGSTGAATNAQALAAIIWEEAICGKFPFVQFIADRIIGKVQLEDLPAGSGSVRFEFENAAPPQA